MRDGYDPDRANRNFYCTEIINSVVQEQQDCKHKLRINLWLDGYESGGISSLAICFAYNVKKMYNLSK
jgi:hypothetical protein